MIRALLVLLVSIIYLILTIPVLLILAIIGIRRPDIRDKAASAMIRWIFRVHLFLAGTKIEVIGREKIPHDTAVLYAGNHRSIFDIIATFNYVYGPTGYVAKKTLGKIPLFNFWEKYIGCLFFDRDNIKEGMQMIHEASDRIKVGQSIFIFPEGTRNRQKKDYPLLPFHEGSFRIATRSGCPIVPVAISNTANIFEAHMPWVKKANVIIEFCDPIPTKDLSRTEKKTVGNHVRDIINQKLEINEKKITASSQKR